MLKIKSNFSKSDIYSINLFTGECPVSLVTHRKSCAKKRLIDIGKARSWYKITDQSSNTDFPLANKIPWLEQNLTAIKYFYALDPFESRHLILVSTWRKILESIAPKLFAAFSKFKYTTNQEFATLYWAWQRAIKVCFDLVNQF